MTAGKNHSKTEGTTKHSFFYLFTHTKKAFVIHQTQFLMLYNIDLILVQPCQEDADTSTLLHIKKLGP